MEMHVAGLMLTVFNLGLIINAQDSIHGPGRHVCGQEHVRLVPVQTTESYCRPKYQKIFVLCSHDNRRICVSHRLMYTTEFKKVVRMVPRRQQIYRCCPGWSSYDWRHNGCMQPICDGGCQNDGLCVLPNRCQCADGWEGTRCEQDINECSSVHGCTHVCENTPGSYQCSCYEGYQLRLDNKTCDFCLTCTDEYEDLIRQNLHLREEIELITTKTNDLEDDIKELRDVLLTVRPYEQPTSMPSVQLSRVEELELRVESLEQQIQDCDCSGMSQLDFELPTPLPLTETGLSDFELDYKDVDGRSGRAH